MVLCWKRVVRHGASLLPTATLATMNGTNPNTLQCDSLRLNGQAELELLATIPTEKAMPPKNELIPRVAGMDASNVRLARSRCERA